MSDYLLILRLLFIPNAYAWDGYEDNGHSVEIEQGNLVREDEDIEVYHQCFKNNTFDNIINFCQILL